MIGWAAMLVVAYGLSFLQEQDELDHQEPLPMLVEFRPIPHPILHTTRHLPAVASAPHITFCTPPHSQWRFYRGPQNVDVFKRVMHQRPDLAAQLMVESAVRYEQWLNQIDNQLAKLETFKHDMIKHGQYGTLAFTKTVERLGALHVQRDAIASKSERGCPSVFFDLP